MDELVERLCNKSNKVATERAESSQELKEQIDRGFVLVKFTETKGGTELGVKLNKDLCKLSDADYEVGRGKVLLVGELTLNYEHVRCFAEIDLTTLQGTGYLESLVEECGE